MSLETECAILQAIPMFEGVDRAKLRLLAMSGDRIIYEAGDVVFRQGDKPDAVYVLLDGVVDVVREGEPRVRLAQLGGNAMFGETGVLCDEPRSATIEAAGPVTVIRVEKHTFNQVVRDVPQLALAIARELARRLETMNEQFANAARH
jgi:CRP-like cAMP-binding protein